VVEWKSIKSVWYSPLPKTCAAAWARTVASVSFIAPKHGLPDQVDLPVQDVGIKRLQKPTAVPPPRTLNIHSSQQQRGLLLGRAAGNQGVGDGGQRRRVGCAVQKSLVQLLRDVAAEFRTLFEAKNDRGSTGSWLSKFVQNANPAGSASRASRSR